MMEFMKRYILGCLLVFFAWIGVLAQTKYQANLGGHHGEMDFVINWKQFYSYDEYVKIMHDLQKKYSSLCDIESIGKSRMGRDQYVLTLTAKNTGKASTKPGFWIDGAIHGNEVNGITCSLYTAWYLLTRYDYDTQVKNILDRSVIYVLPMFNVDANASYLSLPNTENNPREPFRPTDDDGDGLYDEDMTEDIDGDGEISMMYAEDSHGAYRLSKDGNRFIKIPDGDWWGGQRFRLIGPEGYDNDGDGLTGEDDLGGVDPNRNFIYDSNKLACKTYPLSEPETRNVWSFLSSHRNILVTFNFHNAGKWIMYTMPPKSMKTVDTSYMPDPSHVDSKYVQAGKFQFHINRVDPEYQHDQDVVVQIVKDGLFILKDYTAPEETWLNGEAPASMYHMLGAYAFLIELWGSDFPYADFDNDGKISDEEFDKFIKFDLGGEGWIKPKKCHHPQLGDVWIGGSHKKHLDRNPPARYMEEEASKNCMFLVHCMDELPAPKFGNYTVLKKGKNLYQVEVELINDKVFPTISDRSLQINRYVPDKINAKISSGEIIEPIVKEKQEAPSVMSRYFRTAYLRDVTPAGKEVKFRTKGKSTQVFVYNIVASSGILDLTYTSVTGGTDHLSIKLSE